MIKVLDKSVADKIAAGEVIERPVSIVKELVENSIDSGASSIVVEIKKGGKTYLRVTDNGRGIPSDEVETAFLRHATSKITTARDLNAILTLGFRGEALASIAAVTHTEIITKTKNSKTGTKVIIRGSEVIYNSPTGCPDGTTIIITDLFYNTPARLKFLKSDGNESNHIIELMSQIALAYPNIKFRFINNGNVVFSTSGKGDLLATILAVYQISEFKDLVELTDDDGSNRIKGYISKPSLSRTNKKNQIFFVNGRVISSKVIEKGVNEGYKQRLFEGRFPICFLFIDTDPARLDINIHPNKREIRFDDENEIVDLVKNAIIKTLFTDDAVVDVKASHFKRFDAEEVVEEDKKSEQVDIKQILSNKRREAEAVTVSEVSKAPSVHEETAVKPAVSTVTEPKIPVTPVSTEAKTPIKAQDVPIVKETSVTYGTSDETTEVDVSETNGEPVSETAEAHKPERNNFPIEIEKPILRPFNFDDLKLSGAIFDTYITATDGNNFYLIDQHAAHERVFYEKLVSEYLADEKLRQPILTPIVIDVPITIIENRPEVFDGLKEMGFAIEEFGGNSIIIREIPTFMSLSEAEDFVRTFIDSAEAGDKILNTVVINKLITRSCKSAVKANDHLSLMEIEALINQLKACENPFSCPHGRPTFIKFSLYEIEKMFKRV